jgi:hypothetical protein
VTRRVEINLIVEAKRLEGLEAEALQIVVGVVEATVARSPTATEWKSTQEAAINRARKVAVRRS